MNRPRLPDGVGPHDYVEYELMADGKKNLAMFSDLIPSAFVHNPCSLKLGMIRSPDSTCTVYYRHGHETDARRLLDLNLSAYGKGCVPDIEREIGRLLGYEEWQIEAFLKHTNQPFD